MEITPALIAKAQAIREWHPLCELFPLMTPDEFSELTTSIRDHGLKLPILTLGPGGPVADGRNRLLACIATDTEPSFREIEDAEDEAALIWALNYHRRHMTPSQASMAVAKYREYLAGRGDKGQEPDPVQGVPLRTTERALAVLRKAPVEVVAAVQSGHVKVGDAAKQLDLSKTKQKSLVKSVLSGEATTMQSARIASSRAKDRKRLVSQAAADWLIEIDEPYKTGLEHIKSLIAKLEVIADDPQLGIHLPWTRLRVDLESAYGSLYHNEPAQICCGPEPTADCGYCKGAGFLTRFVLDNMTTDQREAWDQR